MDISRASNFERFVFDLLDRDGERVRALWQTLAGEGRFDLSSLQPLLCERYGFVAGTSTHADRLATIAAVHQATGVLIDPHTADGVKVGRTHVEPGIPMLVLETALPAKFAETIREAVGIEPSVPAHLQDLGQRPQRTVDLGRDINRVRDYIAANA